MKASESSESIAAASGISSAVKSLVDDCSVRFRHYSEGLRIRKDVMMGMTVPVVESQGSA